MVAETNHWVVVNKPALLDSQDSRPGRPSLVDWLRKEVHFAGLVHRLDFGTSGLVLCAKNAESARQLSALLQDGKIERSYLAIVLGRIRDERGSLTDTHEGKLESLEFEVKERYPNATLIEVALETGRKHQIRRQFAKAGHPLLGDRLYGKKGAALLFSRPALHAHKLAWGEQKLQVDPPEDFTRLRDRLRSIRS